jgi:hypothetical protein
METLESGDSQLENLVGVEVKSSGSNAIGSLDQAHNAISFNYDGVVLAQGSTVVANSTNSSNTFDGIRITGGAQTIGTAPARTGTSNSFVGNGRWCLSVLTPAAATAQRTVGNLFGATVAGVGALTNRGGNVGIDRRLPATALGWTPNPKTALDKQGNQHGAAIVAGPSPTPNPTPASAPRKRRVFFA